MLPHEICLVGIAAGIVDRTDTVQDSSVSSERVAADGDDDRASRQTEQVAVLRLRIAGNQPFRRRMG